MESRSFNVSLCLKTNDKIIHQRALVLINILYISYLTDIIFEMLNYLQLITHCQYSGIKNTISRFPLLWMMSIINVNVCLESNSTFQIILVDSLFTLSWGMADFAVCLTTSALHHLSVRSRMDIYYKYIWINYIISPAGLYLLLFLLSYQCQCLWSNK